MWRPRASSSLSGGRTQGEEASSSFYRKGIARLEEPLFRGGQARLQGGGRGARSGSVTRRTSIGRTVSGRARLGKYVIANQARELVPPRGGASYARVSVARGNVAAEDPASRHGAMGVREEQARFLVTGLGKSGTRWLTKILDSHPEVLCKGEGRFSPRTGGGRTSTSRTTGPSRAPLLRP